jgi:hypothetical protein
LFWVRGNYDDFRRLRLSPNKPSPSSASEPGSGTALTPRGRTVCVKAHNRVRGETSHDFAGSDQPHGHVHVDVSENFTHENGLLAPAFIGVRVTTSFRSGALAIREIPCGAWPQSTFIGAEGSML